MRKITTFLREKGLIIDIILLVCLVIFVMIWGRNFAVTFFGAISVAFMVLRRIDYEKHVVLKRIILTGLGIVAVSFIIIEALVFTQLGANDQEEADYVIILGSGIKGTELSLTLKQRLDASLDYIQAHPQIPVIVSGGQGQEKTSQKPLP
ncbi:YdcF family protein [Bacillales bacterium AN1005]